MQTAFDLAPAMHVQQGGGDLRKKKTHSVAPPQTQEWIKLLVAEGLIRPIVNQIPQDSGPSGQIGFLLGIPTRSLAKPPVLENTPESNCFSELLRFSRHALGRSEFFQLFRR
jgi:hypothetical protein